MQNRIHNDLIIGSNFGDLGLVTRGNYIPVRKTAHKKMINCLLITDVVKDVSPIFNLQFKEFIFLTCV